MREGEDPSLRRYQIVEFDALATIIIEVREVIRTFCVLTTEANELLADIHHGCR